MVKKSIKSRFTKKDRLGVTARQINAFYLAERRPHIRKRLRALRLVLLGKNPRKPPTS